MERDTRITRIKDALWADRPRIEADFGFVKMTRPDHERGVLYVVVSPFPNADPAIYEASMSNARIDAELQITGPIDPPLGFDTEDQTAWRLQYLESLQYGLIDDLERMVKIARRPRFIWLNSHWSRQLQEQKQLAEMKVRDFFEVAAKRVT